MRIQDDQKEFVVLFRELTRYLLSLQTFVEFRFDRSNLDMTDQEYQDYKSKYLLLYRKHNDGKEVVSVLNDVDFCIELMESDRINVAYIMNLIRNINFESKQTRDRDIEHIKDELDRSDNMRLHKKIDILRAFLDLVVSGFDGTEDIDAEYNDFENKQKSAEIEAFAEKEGIDSAMLNAEITEVQRRRYIQHIAYGKTTREIADEEGCSFQMVAKSIAQAEERIEKAKANRNNN